MAKGRHHFVPKLYLKGFQSAPERINLFNLSRKLPVQNASVRDQCYKHKFHGKTDEIEDQLAQLESFIAPVLQTIRTNNALPRPASEEHEILLGFVALQLLRTTIAAKRINSGTDKAIKQIYACDPRFANVDMEAVEFGYEHAVLASIRNLPEMLEAISDLQAHLLVSTEKVFITSDNPAFKYNQYCQQIQHMGVTGALSKGLQIFLPLAPHLHLVLFDQTTYKVRLSDQFARSSVAAGSDIDTLNRIQLVSADENVYFSDWKQLQVVARLLPATWRHRHADPVVVAEYGQDDDTNASLLHEYDRLPNLDLRLAFLSLKRRARKTPVQDRANDYRKEMRVPGLPIPTSLTGRSATFSRFLGRR